MKLLGLVLSSIFLSEFGLCIEATRLRAHFIGNPVFPTKQHVKGYLSLPYAELYEKFEFWQTPDYDVASRLDWYDGLDTVLNRPDIGEFLNQLPSENS